MDKAESETLEEQYKREIATKRQAFEEMLRPRQKETGEEKGKVKEEESK